MRYLRPCEAAGEGKKTHGPYLKPITAAGILGHFTAAHSHINLLEKSIRSPADELIDQLSVVGRGRVAALTMQPGASDGGGGGFRPILTS